MSYFLPIVSCPEGGIPDQVDESVSGFLVPQRDVERLADRLEQLIKDEPLRTRMGIAGRERYVAKFTDHAFEARLVAILQSVGGVAS
jgi:glycosyltransferase involved in cell wall biosynthesis